MEQLEKRLEELERRLKLVSKRQWVIHNTPEAINRLQEVNRAVPWRGRQVAMEQEETNLANTT